MAGRWRRPRTKVYDCNFNRAESYYKPVMDSLDRKHGSSSLDPVTPLDDRESTPSSRLSRLLDRDRESPAPSTGSRASRLLAEFENGIEPSHKPSRASLMKDDDDIDAEFEATMKKIKASRAKRNAELEEEFDSIASSRKNKISLADQLLDSVGLNSKTQRSIEDDVFSKHQKSAKKFFDEEDDKVMTKWTVVNPAAKALKDAEEAAGESSASARARKSRARLQDIDAELEELDRKSAARQKRISDLKALVAENNAETQSSASSSVKVTKRITVKQSSEKKQVSF